MSWLKKAYTIMTPNPKAYYTVVDLPTYYEWQFNNAIPAGTVFTKQMPRSDVLSENVIIASAVIPEESLQPIDSYFRLRQNTQPILKHVAGQAKNPSEVVASFDRIATDIEGRINNFKQSAALRRYFIGGTEEPHLYRVAECHSDRVVLDNLGTVEDLNTKIAEYHRYVEQESAVKRGRSFDIEDRRRFENAVTKLRNAQLPLDSADIDFLVAKARIIPVNTRTIPWRQCLLEISSDAVEMDQKLSMFNSLKWVRKLAQS